MERSWDTVVVGGGVAKSQCDGLFVGQSHGLGQHCESNAVWNVGTGRAVVVFGRDGESVWSLAALHGEGTDRVETHAVGAQPKAWQEGGRWEGWRKWEEWREWEE